MRPKPFGFHRPGTHQATPAAHLSAAILDSQSVKTTDRGPYSCDGAKRLQRRKRHLLVDTLGLVGKVQVIAADVGRPRPFLDWPRQRRGMAFQVMQHRHGGHKLRWLPPGATPRSCRRSRWSRGGGGRADLCLARSVSVAQQGLRDRPRQPAAVAVAEGRQRSRARSGVQPSPSPSRSAPSSPACPGKFVKETSQYPEDNFGFTVGADQQLRDRAQRLNPEIS